jgi:NAD(P)-dependent dehydrogenase (short-subunit alcohol dehydrogenase family)
MTNPLDMTGRRVLVTGASSGIGRDTALLLSTLGATLILVGRDEGRLDASLQSLTGTGHQVEVFDLSNVLGIPAWIKGIATASGPLSGLVHSAGMTGTSPLRFQTPEEVSTMFKVNVESAFALAKGFRQKGVCLNPASLVFLSSVAGLTGVAGKSAYGASKAALVSLAASLALELARDGIRVNCVAPGWVETEMTRSDSKNLTPEQYEVLKQRHLLGLGQPRDVAHAIAFLLADTARWITGTTLVVDGGYTAQ